MQNVLVLSPIVAPVSDNPTPAALPSEGGFLAVLSDGVRAAAPPDSVPSGQGGTPGVADSSGLVTPDASAASQPGFVQKPVVAGRPLGVVALTWIAGAGPGFDHDLVGSQGAAEAKVAVRAEADAEGQPVQHAKTVGGIHRDAARERHDELQLTDTSDLLPAPFVALVAPGLSGSASSSGDGAGAPDEAGARLQDQRAAPLLPAGHSLAQAAADGIPGISSASKSGEVQSATALGAPTSATRESPSQDFPAPNAVRSDPALAVASGEAQLVRPMEPTNQGLTVAAGDTAPEAAVGHGGARHDLAGDPDAVASALTDGMTAAVPDSRMLRPQSSSVLTSVMDRISPTAQPVAPSLPDSGIAATMTSASRSVPEPEGDPPAESASATGQRDSGSGAGGAVALSQATPAASGFWESLLTSLSGMAPSDAAGQSQGIHHRSGAGSADAGEADDLTQRLVAQPLATPAPTTGMGIVALAEQMTQAAAQSDALDTDPGSDALTFLPSGLQSLLGQPVAGPVTAMAAPAPLPVPQVAGQISAALSQGSDGVTELALSPDELGHVKLRLERDTRHPDRMVVMITFERPETMDLFRRHAGELADALRSAGFAGADIGFGQQGGNSSGADAAPGRPASSPESAFGPGSPVDAPPHPSSNARPAAGASLDLRL